MPRLPVIALALLLAALAAGCGRDQDADGAHPDMDAAGSVLEWRGSLPCADCEAIDTRLLLERRGDERVYELMEVYVSVDGDMSFEESGRWSLDDGLLDLEAAGGGVRRYGLVQGGALQVRDPRGRTYPGREHDLLLPAGYHP